MKDMKRYRGVRFGICVGLAALAVGCTSRQSIERPRQYIAQERPGRIWVTHQGSVLEVTGPRLLGDTLVGFFNGEYQEVVVPNLGVVEAERTDRTRTALLVGGIVAGIGLGSYMLWGADSGAPQVPCDECEESVVPAVRNRPAAWFPLLRLTW